MYPFAFVLTALASLTIIGSQARADDGVQAFAHVCRGSDGAISSARSLSLHEGETLYALELDDVKDDELKTAELKASSIVKLNPYVLSQLPSSLEALVSQTQISDLGLHVTEQGCRSEVVARSSSQTTVLDQAIWSRLPKADRASTLLNLALDKLLAIRDLNEEHRSRKIIAHLFAHVPFEPVIPLGAIPDLICMDTESTPSQLNTAFAVVIRDNTADLYFIAFDGQPVVSQKRVEFDASIFDLNDPQGQMVWGTTESHFENRESIALIRGATLQLQVRRMFGNPNAGGDYNISCMGNKKGAPSSAF